MQRIKGTTLKSGYLALFLVKTESHNRKCKLLSNKMFHVELYKPIKLDFSANPRPRKPKLTDFTDTELLAHKSHQTADGSRS